MARDERTGRVPEAGSASDQRWKASGPVPREAREAGVAPVAGTTHDPNSVTTGTEAEPKGDVFPPPGTRD